MEGDCSHPSISHGSQYPTTAHRRTEPKPNTRGRWAKNPFLRPILATRERVIACKHPASHFCRQILAGIGRVFKMMKDQ